MNGSVLIGCGIARQLRLAGAGMIAAGLLLASPHALAQQGWDQDLGQKQLKPLGSEDEHPDAYSAAMALKQKGDYEHAMPLLEAIARLGRGYEVAQFELGDCYYDQSRIAPSKQEAEKLRTTGLGWILESANAGFGEAETELVRLYLDGDGVPVDPVEAGKWYLLWRHNSQRMQIGAGQFDAVLERRLKAALRDTDWKDAQNRADTWQPS